MSCECHNDCGDDPNVRAGNVKGCGLWRRVEANRLHAEYVAELVRGIRNPHCHEMLQNGLAHIVREYPHYAEPARVLMRTLQTIHEGPEGLFDSPLRPLVSLDQLGFSSPPMRTP